MLPAWAAVAAHAKDMAKVHLRDLAGTDARRWQQCHVEYDTWLLDISRQRITQQSLALLLELARAVDLSDRIAAMFRGDPINTTEKRAVLHAALRSDFPRELRAILAEVKASRQKLKNYGSPRRGGQKTGCDGQEIQARREHRHRGFGSRALVGMRCAARGVGRRHHAALRVQRRSHAARGFDARTLDPAETAGHCVLEDFRDTGDANQRQRGKSLDRRCARREGSRAIISVAVSTNAEAMDKFGIAADHRFTMWDWVGVAKLFGLVRPLASLPEIVIGSSAFEEFLKGASDIDRHFTTAPFENNSACAAWGCWACGTALS